ncbi:alpha-(1,6)-fucosyltransferase-like isoform X3 [Lytechinus variegatus]|uniref:alpha-(1,6)-fucosyltransferase-like isoform X3 n=1 Tax=Lytechinus variegatus TaxID=7654 RepID=UPI001BB245FA|nr:alpha-(1,6)-fucosyltransferase-like isoform X3 [Lytechinus variegatus]
MRMSYKFGLIMGLTWLGGLIYLKSVGEQQDLAKELIIVRQKYEDQKIRIQQLEGLVARSSYNDGKEGVNVISRMERENKGNVQDTRQQEQASDSNSNLQYCGSEPSLAYEKIRRKIDNGVTEIWYYIRSQLTQLKKSSGDQKTQVKIDQILEDGGEQQRSIMTDIYNLSRVDGYSSWRQKEAKELTKLVQQRLRYVQNPKDCSKVKKISCNIRIPCGYGCQLHHVTYCLLVAFATGRTLVLDSKGMKYAKEGLDKYFLPLSETCLDHNGNSTGRWGQQGFEDLQVLTLPIIGGFHPRPDWLPLAIPQDISQRLMRLHGNPIVWWMGQLVMYIQRPQPSFQKDIDKMKEAIGFTHPIVGYPDYVFIGDHSIAKSAGLSSRYSDDSLRGIILDIYFLSRTDFFVGTFSSQVSRAVYEMMQYLHEEGASANFRSLDDIYFFCGMHGRNQTALYKHKPRGPEEIEMKPGDIISVAGNHWDGYSKGTNLNSGSKRTGLYPSYKAEINVRIAKMPTYPEAENFHL